MDEGLIAVLTKNDPLDVKRSAHESAFMRRGERSKMVCEAEFGLQGMSNFFKDEIGSKEIVDFTHH